MKYPKPVSIRPTVAQEEFLQTMEKLGKSPSFVLKKALDRYIRLIGFNDEGPET